MTDVLITAAAVPDLPADGQMLLDAAGILREKASRVLEHVDSAGTRWATLPGSFDTPDTVTLVAGWAPVTAAADDFHDTADAVGRALTDLGEVLVQLAKVRQWLLEDITTHRSLVATYRSDNPTAEADGDPFAGWGPNGRTTDTDLWERCAGLRRSFEDALDTCTTALRRIPDGYGFWQVTAAGASSLATPTSLTDAGERFRTGIGLAVLNQLGTDPDRIAALLTAHPEWADLLRDNPPSPTDVAAWWASLTDPTGAPGWSGIQAALIAAAPAMIGGLGGVPSTARRDANRLVATQRRDHLQQQIDDRGWTYAAGTYERVRIGVTADQQAELDYLDRVAAGKVDLYLYDPDRGRIIEMYGNPEEADVITTFLPGTNTTMQSFYSSTDTTGVSALTRWEVENPAVAGVDIAGFVVKQGAFPQLTSDIVFTGPQNNDMMEALGRSYAELNEELQTIAPDTPQVSVEHSAGSAAAGEAEMEGATFAARVTLAGIGMTDRWEPQDGVDYYAIQAPNDINRNLDDIQVGNWGYATPANASSGYTELDSGVPGTSPWTYAILPLSPPLALGIEGTSQIDHHNQIMSGDPSENGITLQQIQRILAEQRNAQ